MDPIQQVFATGGVTGVTAVVLYMVYRFFNERHRVRSSCCGKVMEIETQSATPPKSGSTENINPMVEDGRKPNTTRKNSNFAENNEESV